MPGEPFAALSAAKDQEVIMFWLGHGFLLPRRCSRLPSSYAPDIVRLHGPSSAQRPHPTGDGLPDLVGRIFLDEMDPPDSHLGLRCKPAGEVENRATSEDPT